MSVLSARSPTRAAAMGVYNGIGVTIHYGRFIARYEAFDSFVLVSILSSVASVLWRVAARSVG